MHSDDTIDLLDFSMDTMYAQPAAVAERVKSDRNFAAEQGERLIQAAAARQARAEVKSASSPDVATAQLDAAVLAYVAPTGSRFATIHALVRSISRLDVTSEEVSRSLRRLSAIGLVAYRAGKWVRS